MAKTTYELFVKNPINCFRYWAMFKNSPQLNTYITLIRIKHYNIKSTIGNNIFPIH